MQARGEDKEAVEGFTYASCPGAPPVVSWDGWMEAGGDATEAAEDCRSGDRAAGANFAERLAEETRRAFQSGQERGREEGRRAEREALAPTAAAEAERRRSQAGELAESFARERDRYLEAVEQEVVRLALAVAARILRREAQMDPLLLTGAVRVALGQLAATSEIRLRVPAREAEMWKETVALLPKLPAKPLVVADETMQIGECTIESKAGTVDLGIRSQLGEIERGFFDRAAASDAPAGKSPAGALPEANAAEVRA